MKIFKLFRTLAFCGMAVALSAGQAHAQTDNFDGSVQVYVEDFDDPSQVFPAYSGYKIYFTTSRNSKADDHVLDINYYDFGTDLSPYNRNPPPPNLVETITLKKNQTVIALIKKEGRLLVICRSHGLAAMIFAQKDYPGRAPVKVGG